MHTKSGNNIITAMGIGLLLLGNFSFAQNFLPGEGRADYRPLGALVWSEESQLGQDRGKAAMHVSYMIYIFQLQNALLDNHPEVVEQYGDRIGISPDEVERLYALLKEFDTRSADLRQAIREEECRPLLAGESITNEAAKEAVARMDSDTPREELLQSVLQNISNAFGEEVEQRMQDYVDEIDKSLRFTPADNVRDIEQNQGGNYLGWLQSQCSAL